LLFYTIKEVATENKVPENQAAQKFFEDIEKNYDNRLRYDSTLKRKSEIENSNRELNTTRSELSLNKEVAQVVTGLLATGFSDQQTLDFASFLQSVHANCDVNSLKSDMEKYGNLKQAFEALDQILRNLESQTSLQK
jgi:hypothetical protein